MKSVIWIVLAAGGLALAGCGGDSSGSTASTTSPGGNTSGNNGSGGPPTDFASFVTQQVQTQPAFGAVTPASTGSLTTDLALENASAFANVSFGAGDALPTATYQGAAACTQAGKSACNPAVSADLNSNLN